MSGLERNGISSAAVPERKTSVIWNPDSCTPAPVRKISNVLHGYDNLSFDSPRSRKISTTSSHEEVGPVRKKSSLHNSNYVTDTLNNGKFQVIFQAITKNP